MRFRTVQPLNPAIWLLAPALIAAAAELLLAAPVKLFGLQLPEPVFGVAAAFAWAVIRPSILPPFVLIGLGLFQDVLWGGPLGLWPASLLAVYALAFSARRILINEDFWPLCAWFAGAGLGGFATAFLLSALAAGEAPSLVGVALQWVATVVLFPLSWMLIERFEDADVRFR